jgi:hypothetical protein
MLKDMNLSNYSVVIAWLLAGETNQFHLKVYQYNYNNKRDNSL